MRRMRFLVPVAIAGALIAGCQSQSPTTPTPPATTAPADNGVKDLTADEILKKATDELKAAGSYRMKGDMEVEGEKMTLDVAVKGDDISGTMTMPQGTIKILVVGGVFYFQAGEDFWKAFAGDQGDAIAVLFKDKWVKVGADDESLGAFADMANAETILKPEGTITKGEIKTIEGQSAIGLVESGTDSGTIYIATTGKPYPVAMVPNQGTGQLVFTEVGKVTEEIKAPDPASVVDLGALTGNK